MQEARFLLYSAYFYFRTQTQFPLISDTAPQFKCALITEIISLKLNNMGYFSPGHSEPSNNAEWCASLKSCRASHISDTELSTCKVPPHSKYKKGNHAIVSSDISFASVSYLVPSCTPADKCRI